VKHLFIVIGIFCSLLLFNGSILAQQDSLLVQFSGLILTEENNQLVPLPFTNVTIKGTTRGTYANLDGFFSIVAGKGDVVVFSAVGFKSVEYQLPQNLRDNRYYMMHLMVEDTLMLPVTMIYPWPSKEHFRIEFLEMDISDEMYDRAIANLNERTLSQLREGIQKDGGETGSMHLRQQARDYYTIGQMPQQNIFNPLAWRDFFKAWKEGKFRKQEDKK
jgi:hypothetical protein